jgi:hypothetical protein
MGRMVKRGGPLVKRLASPLLALLPHRCLCEQSGGDAPLAVALRQLGWGVMRRDDRTPSCAGLLVRPSTGAARAAAR